MRRHLQRVGLGVVLVGLVILLIDVPSLPMIETSGYAATLFLALLTVTLGGWYLLERGVADGEWWQPVNTEPGYHVPVPGDELADCSERELKNRIRRRVIRSLVDATNCSRAVAETRVENGTWTDNRLAQLYLSSADAPERVNVSLVSRFIAKLCGESIEKQARRQTIRALREIREGSSS